MTKRARHFAAAAWLTWAAVGSCASSAAPPPPSTEPPMRFLQVRGNDPACRPHCAEWISAEGQIQVGSAQAFAAVIGRLGDRPLPILINSPGGSVEDAIAMGRLIRAKHLSVAVAHTILAPCDPNQCGDPTGVVSAWNAYCASACPLVLAGGVERYVSPVGRVGVHQITRFVTHVSVLRTYRVKYRIVGGRRQEISRNLVGETRNQTTAKETEPPQVDSELSLYLKEMGIGPTVMKLIDSTPPSGVRWLTADELKTSGLVTLWFDRPSGMETAGANGLSGAPVDDSSEHRAVLIADAEAPFAAVDDHPGFAVEARIAYRRGGGAVSAEFSTRGGGEASPGFEVNWKPSTAGPPFLKSTFGPSLAATIPRADFCADAQGGRLAISRLDTPASPAVVDIAAAAGMKALLAEACAPMQALAQKGAAGFNPPRPSRPKP